MSESGTPSISTRLPPPRPQRLRVLLTGATGYIASQLLPVFRERYDLVLVDVRTTDAVPEARLANLLEDPVDDLRKLFEGVDAVVHLGYFRPPGMSVTGEGKSYLDE